MLSLIRLRQFADEVLSHRRVTDTHTHASRSFFLSINTRNAAIRVNVFNVTFKAVPSIGKWYTTINGRTELRRPPANQRRPISLLDEPRMTFVYCGPRQLTAFSPVPCWSLASVRTPNACDEPAKCRWPATIGQLR